jgi:glyoxylase-like metal-dependent hydrolase (beta-lactamase superfamily II)
MKLHTIDTGFFKLDGGAMHGVVPKSLWNKINPADENNLCTWAMRCLLVETDDRLILIDNGIGNKQDAKFFSYYFLHGNDSLKKSLKKAGYGFGDITDMFLSHLHFDHCGGSIIKNNEDKLETAFPNAIYWSQPDHWQWATRPNAREKASFLKENILPIQDSGQLKFIHGEGRLYPNFSVTFVDGHTEKMMLPHIHYKGRTVVFMADLIPSAGHIPVAYIMAYDTRPLLTLSEKEKFLKEAAENDYILFFEHDPKIECCTLQQTDRGARIKDTFLLNEI